MPEPHIWTPAHDPKGLLPMMTQPAADTVERDKAAEARRLLQRTLAWLRETARGH